MGSNNGKWAATICPVVGVEIIINNVLLLEPAGQSRKRQESIAKDCCVRREREIYVDALVHLENQNYTL